MNISVSSRLPEKGRGDVIFGSLKKDRAGGVWDRGTCDGEKQGGVGSGQEPDGRGREWRGSGCGETQIEAGKMVVA